MDKPINKITVDSLPKCGRVLLFGLGAEDSFRPLCLAEGYPDAVVTLRPMTLQERRKHQALITNCARLESHNMEVMRKATESGEFGKIADYSDEVAQMEDVLFACITGVVGVPRADGESATADDLKAGAPEELKAEIFNRILQISGISRDESANLGC
jgi:hypothetical protein